MIAAGMYLRTLREQQDITRDDLAYRTGTNGVQIMRIEKGEVDTRGSLLLSLVKHLRGSAEHVMNLLADDGATAEDGQRLALAWMSKEDKAQLDHFIANASDEQFQEAIRLLEEISQREGIEYPLGVLRAMKRRA